MAKQNKPVDWSKPLHLPRHEAFAHDCLSLNASDAYRKNYPKSAHSKRKNIHEAASKLYSKVYPRIQFFQSQAAQRLEITAGASLRESFRPSYLGAGSSLPIGASSLAARWSRFQ